MQVPLTRNAASTIFLSSTVVTLGLALMVLGCSGTSPQRVASQVAPQGKVYLQEIPDWSFEASHPETLAPEILASVLRGVHADDSESLSVGGGRPMRVFSDEDVAFLAPLLAQQLSQAQPEHVVAFELSSSAGSGSAPTAGNLYLQRGALYLTLTDYQGRLGKTESSWFGRKPMPASFTFKPDDMATIDNASSSVVEPDRSLRSIIVDQTVLAQLPTVEPATPLVSVASAEPSVSMEAMMPERMTRSREEPAPTPAVPTMTVAAPAPQPERRSTSPLPVKIEDLQHAKQVLVKKESQLAILRRDIDSLRNQLEAKDKELRALKAKLSVKSTKKTATITRR